MIEIGEKPILWHIMKIYSHFGFNDFVICLGYKGYCIKEYFAHYYLYESDVTFDFRCENQQVIHTHHAEPWRVTLVNTGIETMTGGRIRRIRKYVGEESFLLTYGDGLGDVDIRASIEFHRQHGKIATVTATQPTGRYGALGLGYGDLVTDFREKPSGDGAWVNAGFFVMEPAVFDYIDGDTTILEREPMEKLAREEQLVAYKHGGFWQPMDTLRDKVALEKHWQTGNAPWKVWPE